MNTFALEVWYDEGAACAFYTARYIGIENDSLSETDKFFDKYAVSEQPYEEEALQLFRLITESIGNKYGAIDDFFDRHENRVQDLPPKPKQCIKEIKMLGSNFPLRLYCYRVTEQIVVLFNGGIKDAPTAQRSEDLSMKFNETQSLARKIETGLREGMICISTCGRKLESFDGSSEIIL